MRVCVCNCGSHPHLSFPFFNLSQHPVARHPTARDTIYRITSLSITTYPYASHKPVERDRSIDPLGRSGFLIFFQSFPEFSNFLRFLLSLATFFIGVSRRWGSGEGVPILLRYLGRNLTTGLISLLRRRLPAAGQLLVRLVATELILRRQDCHEFCGNIASEKNYR